MYNIFLDDERDPSDVVWIKLPLVHWVVVRNYFQFVETILKSGIPTIISADHDLADEHYVEYGEACNSLIIGKPRIRYEKFKEKTGYDCCKWLVNYCLDNNLDLPEIYIHTMNPIGRENIQSLIDNYKKVRENR